MLLSGGYQSSNDTHTPVKHKTAKPFAVVVFWTLQKFLISIILHHLYVSGITAPWDAACWDMNFVNFPGENSFSPLF